ncbi:MAG: hypothetical protein R3D33_09795 [Hyphomicrobiaceae bacterium]
MPMSILARRIVAAVTAVAMLLGPALPAVRAETAAGPALSQACEVSDELQFRAGIERLVRSALDEGVAGVDFEAVVRAEWLKLGLDSAVDARVDKTVEEVKDQSSWGTLLSTLASREASQKLATEVAERTYRSDEMKAAIEGLATAVGREIGTRIELATLDAALPAVACVRSFLGPRYGSTVSLIVSDDTGRTFEVDAANASASVGTSDVVLSGKGLIAGAVILIVRRSLSNMARRIGQRVVGAVLGRLVSVVAGGIGLVLIAKDIWDMRHGVLPIIEEEMKSEDMKEKIRVEIAAAISEQLGTHLGEIASETADRILGVWRQFKEAHAKVVDLAARSQAFRAFLDTVDRKGLPRADRVVALVLGSEGEAGVMKRLEDGTLDEAVKRLPDGALGIATDRGSLAAGLAWARLAGTDVGKVEALELHRVLDPAGLTAATLSRLLALPDETAVRRIARLGPADRDALLAADPARVSAIVRTLPDDETAAFAGFLRRLAPITRERLVEAVAADPGLMRRLARPAASYGLTESRDQQVALDMLMRNAPMLDPVHLLPDIQHVTDGKVHPVLLWERHPAAILLAGFLILVLLLVLRRILFSRPRSAPA